LIKSLALIVLAAGSITAQTAAIASAQNFYQRTEYEKAIQAVGASQDAAALALAGKSYFHLGDFKKASELLGKAAEKMPGNSSLMHWLGKAYGRRAETSSFLTAPRWAGRCRDAFEKAVELDGKNLEALSDLMEYYLEAPGFLGGGFDKAAAIAARMRAIHAAEGESAQARLAEKKKDWPASEKHLRKALELEPGELGRALDLAKFLARRERWNESEEMFARAAKMAPEHPRLLFARAEVLVEHKRNLGEARRLLEKYLKSALTPDDPSRREAAELLKKAKES